MPQAQARRDSTQSPDVARLVRLHHQRRGWAWVATGCVIGLAVYAGIDVRVFGSLARTTEAVSLIPGSRTERAGRSITILIITETRPLAVHAADPHGGCTSAVRA